MITENFIIRIAAKLHNDGITTDNYTEEKAVKILNNTVAPSICIKTLRENEAKVKELIASFESDHA